MSDLSILMEYYVGNSRDKRFKQCEECLKELIEEMRPQQDLDNRYNIMRKRQDYSFHPANMKLRELLAGIFNMKGVNIYWDNGSINGYTYSPPIFYKIKNKENIKDKDKKRVNMTAHIVLFEDLITKADLNEKELMAVILHELGHNVAIMPLRMFSTLVQSTIGIPITLLLKGIEAIDHFLNDKIIYRYLYPIINFIDMLNDCSSALLSFTGFIDTLNTLKGLLTGRLKLRLPSDPIQIIDSIGGYQEEKAADSFAAVYGYGPYQVSALDKMSKARYRTDQQIKRGAGLEPMYHILDDLNSLILDPIFAILLEPHPNHNVRYYNIRRKLESDLNSKNLPPEYKKELQEQLTIMDEMYEKLDKYSDEELVTFRKSIYKLLDILTKGHSDWREILSGVDKSLNF